MKKLLSVLSAAGLLAVHAMPAAALPSQAAEPALSAEDTELLHEWGTTDDEIAQILAYSAKTDTTQLNCYSCIIGKEINKLGLPLMYNETVCHPAEVTFFDCCNSLKFFYPNFNLAVNALSLPAAGLNGEPLLCDSFSLTLGYDGPFGAVLYTAPKGFLWKENAPSAYGLISSPLLAGDINQDDKVDVTDLVYFAKYVNNTNPPDDFCRDAAWITPNYAEIYKKEIDAKAYCYELLEQYLKGEIDCFWTKQKADGLWSSEKEPVIPAVPSIQAANTVTDFRRELEAASLDTETNIGQVLEAVKKTDAERKINTYRLCIYDTQDKTGTLTQKKMVLQDGVTTVQQRLNDTDYLLRLHPVDLAVNEYKACTAVQETVYDLNTRQSVTTWSTTNYIGGVIIHGPFYLGDPETDDGYYEVYFISLHYNYGALENPDATARIIDVIPHGTEIGKTKDEIVLPTEIDGLPVEEIAPGAYGQLLYMPDSTGTKTQLVYYDPFSEEEPFVLDEEISFGSGDTDNNGAFTVGDAIYCARIIAEDKTLNITDAGLAAADMDANDFVDVDDLVLMLKLLSKDFE